MIKTAMAPAHSPEAPISSQFKANISYYEAFAGVYRITRMSLAGISRSDLAEISERQDLSTAAVGRKSLIGLTPTHLRQICH